MNAETRLLLSTYRRALRLARAQPSQPMRDASVSNFRILAETQETAALLSRIAALRAILPRRLWPSSEIADAHAHAYSHADKHALLVDRHVRRKRHSTSFSKVRGVHADDLARHNALMERFRFGGPKWQR